MKRTLGLFFAIIILFVAFALVVNKDMIFQEGNPLPIVKGMLSLDDKTTYVKIKENPPTYLTKTNQKDDLFAFIEETNEVSFMEQLGSGYFFEGDGKVAILTSRQYSGSYQVWKYSEKAVEGKLEGQPLNNIE
ncbi:MAG TPA: hypothetical protein GX525_03880 [Bacilli bacterium]|nr:hypothetical protein [Bacilli bacterium]